MEDCSAGYALSSTPTPLVRSATLQERLDLAVQQAEERLAEAKEVRDFFACNLDLERLLNM